MGRHTDPAEFADKADRVLTKAAIVVVGAIATGVLAWLGMGTAASIAAIAAVGLLWVTW